MSYQVLARKCRPQRFSEIVGQQHITQTLQNAIMQERVGHAYLFVGPRGTGKTTTARIFAKALNCEKGTVNEPCCECRSCQEIANGSALDVMEIDGASHNKVEHVRDLRENVQYAPNRSRYKIYIIDEVHMLTTQAWNALLKTLEEPPSHVKFFFATTEPHKVLPTIVSRCQRFDLQRLSVPLIANRLREIAESESIAIDERALIAIARAADGAMRDGQSIFDQIIAFCGTGSGDQAIAEEDVINVFGLASGRELTNLAKAVAANNIQQTVKIIHELAERGRDLERLFGDLILFLRNAMVFQVCENPQEILDVSETELADIRELAEIADPRLVQRLLEGLAGEEGSLRNALNKRVYLEVVLVQVMHHAHDLQIEKLISRLNELRGVSLPGSKKNESSPPDIPRNGPVNQPESVTAASPTGPPPNPSPAPPQNQSSAPAQSPPPAPPVEAANDEMATDADDTAGATEVATSPPEQSPALSGPPPPAPEEQAETTDAAKPASESAAAASAPEAPPPDDTTIELRDHEAVENAGTAETSPHPDETDMEIAETPGDPASLWHLLIEAVGHIPKKHQLKTYMQELRPVSHLDGCLQVAYDNEFPEEHVQLLLQNDNLQTLETSLQRITGNPNTRLLIKRWREGVSDENRRQRLVSSPEIRERLEHNPFVQKVREIFKAELVDVRG